MAAIPPTTEVIAEGGDLMLGEDGQRYVTVVQDGQTYAIPESDYHAMQQQPGVEGDLQTRSETPAESGAHQHAVMVSVSQPPSTMTLQPVSGPPPMMRQKNPQQQQLGKAAISPVQLLNRTFKPIRVDNWGIFLLNRLQTFFQKKEHCDLTLRFPSKNAQIKVHRLVVDACTDYFLQQEKEGNLVDGAIDMSSDFTPDTVAPIIRFMYTGRLDLRAGMFSKLHDAATKLQMSVLAKLMDAQLSSPSSEDPRKKIRRKSSKAEDPVKQIRKIKKIERTVMHEEKKARMQAKLEAFYRREEKDYGEDTLPGKKLPIWKRRSNQPEETSSAKPQQPAPQQQLLHSRTLHGPPSGAKLVPVNAPPGAEKSLVTPSPRSYKRNSPSGERRPRIPRQIREIQENLTFEKIRRTGAKNVSGPTVQGDTPTKDMSVEEIREFMEEQRKRLQQMGEEEEDDDYADNDAGMDYGDDLEDDEVEEEENAGQEMGNQASTPATPSTAKPILKSDVLLDVSSPRKSVRFSLRPGDPPMRKATSSGHLTAEEPQHRVVSTGKKRGRPPKMKAADSIIDDFHKAVEEEEALAKEKVATSRSGRPIISKTHVDLEKVQTLSASPPAKKRRILSGDENDTSHSIDLPIIIAKSTAEGSANSQSPEQARIIEEVLKQHPDIFKNHQQVKLRVTVNDSEGRSSMQCITLRATSSSSGHGIVVTPEAALALVHVPKVAYTGRRGRPKKVKLGDEDRNEGEMAKSPQRLNSVGESLITFGEVSSRDLHSNVGTVKLLDSSSEAEALSNLSSGIATPLGVVDTTRTLRPLSDLDHFDDQTIVINYEETMNTNADDVVFTAASHGSHKKRPNAEGATEKLHGATEKGARSRMKKTQGLSKLAMDWDDDE